jgi:hypothetical protein
MFKKESGGIMTLDEGLKYLGGRFISMNRLSNVDLGDGQLVTVTKMEVDFKSNIDDYKWVLFNSQDGRIILIKKEKTDTTYYVCSTNSEISYNDILEHCKLIIDTNLETEQKTGLMKKKMGELGKLFTDLTYDELKTITFTYKKNKKKNKISINKQETIEPPKGEKKVVIEEKKEIKPKPKEEKKQEHQKIIFEGVELTDEVPLVEMDENQVKPQVLVIGGEEERITVPNKRKSLKKAIEI